MGAQPATVATMSTYIDTVGPMTEKDLVPSSLWRHVSEQPDHPAAHWDGTAIGDDLTLDVWLGPLNPIGAGYFRLYLNSCEMGRSEEPVVLGMLNSGRYPGFNWVEVIEYHEQLAMYDKRTATVPQEVEQMVFRRLAEVVPSGGHLMAEYDSPTRRMTARALATGVPPRATPLGATIAASGCGVAFRDWYISEGGREGPRKLQGFRAANETHERQRNQETLVALEAFMRHSAHLEWDLQACTRMLAQQAIEELDDWLHHPDTSDSVPDRE